MKTFGQNDPKVADYAIELLAPEDEVLREVRERSHKEGLPDIQVGLADGLHLEIIARASGAQKAVEIGTLGGYSGISILRGLTSRDKKLFTFEFSPKHAKVATLSFEKAGFKNDVEIFVGPALENLPKINSQGPFDLVFIDADKENYPRYLDWAAENLRTGGVVLGDNTFAWGMIADTEFSSRGDEKQVTALRAFNEKAARGGRFRTTILPTGEGLTMAVKVR